MTNIVVLMAGEGTRFNFNVPKPYIQFKNIPLFHHATESFSRKDDDNCFIFVVQKKHLSAFPLDNFLSKYYSNYKIVVQNGKRNGPAASMLEATKYIDNDDGLYILDCDQLNIFDPLEISKKISNIRYCGAILYFKSVDESHSFINIDSSNKIIDIKEKQVISENSCAGIYYWSKGRDFLFYCKKHLDKINDKKEAYVSGVYNIAIDEGKEFKGFESKKALSAGDQEKYYKFINNIYAVDN